MYSLRFLRNSSINFTPLFHSSRLSAVNGIFCKSQVYISEMKHYCPREIVHRCNKSINLTTFRYFSEIPKNTNETDNPTLTSKEELSAENIKTAKINIFKRLILAIQSYGIVFLVMVVVTGTMWFTLCYLATKTGINIIPILNFIHSPQWIIDKLSNRGVSELATAYVLYKLISPIRYAVTFQSTKIVTKKLQDLGYLSKVSEENRIRNIAKEGRELSRQILTDKKNQSTKILKDKFEKKWGQK